MRRYRLRARIEAEKEGRVSNLSSGFWVWGNVTSLSAGNVPITRTLSNINGQASVVFQIPFSVSPHSWPIRNTFMQSRSLVSRCAAAQTPSATHFEREYPSGEAEAGLEEIHSGIGDIDGGQITLAVEEQNRNFGGVWCGEESARVRRLWTPSLVVRSVASTSQS